MPLEYMWIELESYWNDLDWFGFDFDAGNNLNLVQFEIVFDWIWFACKLSL